MAGDGAPIRFDFHTHSTYSDGAELAAMAEMAADCGLDGLGFADHCNVTDPALRSHEVYSLHETYEARREEIRELNDEYDVQLFDAVELDYVPGQEATLERFLESAGFEYSLGSVHHVDGRNVMHAPSVDDLKDEELADLVEDYFATVVSLVESELFDVVSHLDVVSRNPALRGIPEREHYERVAMALQDSRTVPEVNLGRTTREAGVVHPDPASLDTFDTHGIEFVVGTDAHRPQQLAACLEFLTESKSDLPVDFVDESAPFL